jgi:hypothetical protein
MEVVNNTLFQELPMYFTLTRALQQIKSEWAQHLEADAISEACQAVGYRWRQRRLGPVATVQLFALQILHGNTAINHLRHLAGLALTAAAYCQARARLPLAVLQRLLQRVSRSVDDDTAAEGRWRGHRVFHVDGSSFSMPDTPQLQQQFGQPGAQQPGCGFPVAHLLALFHAQTGVLRQVLAAPLRTHDLSQVALLHPALQPGDVLVGDRAFCSFAHFALLAGLWLQGLFRLHQRQIVDFTPQRRYNAPGRKPVKGWPTSRWLRSLGVTDQLVEWFKPKKRPEWLTAAQ